MHTHTLIAYGIVAFLSILSPGPAVLLAVRNGLAYGPRAALWSSLGNVCGIFCLSAAAVLGLGAVLVSSAWLFETVKLVGAMYLFYVGWRQLRAGSIHFQMTSADHAPVVPGRYRLYREAFLLATTNPKPILFFTALFPQFIQASSPLAPQFLILTALFMVLSFLTLMGYAVTAARTKLIFVRPLFSRWISRVMGGLFMTFGAVLLLLRRPVS